MRLVPWPEDSQGLFVTTFSREKEAGGLPLAYEAFEAYYLQAVCQRWMTVFNFNVPALATRPIIHGGNGAD
jgi:hypothetical protein